MLGTTETCHEKLLIEAGLWNLIIDAAIDGPRIIQERLKELVPKWKENLGIETLKLVQIKDPTGFQQAENFKVSAPTAQALQRRREICDVVKDTMKRRMDSSVLSRYSSYFRTEVEKALKKEHDISK